MELVSGAVEVRRDEEGELLAVLRVVDLSMDQQRLLGDAVRGVGLLRVPVPQVVFGERHGGELRVRADGAEQHRLVDAGSAGRLDDVRPHQQVGQVQRRRLRLVEADAADTGGEVDHLRRAVIGEHVGGGAWSGEVVVAAADGDDVGPGGLQLGDDAAPEEPGASGDDDASAVPECARRRHSRQSTSHPRRPVSGTMAADACRSEPAVVPARPGRRVRGVPQPPAPRPRRRRSRRVRPPARPAGLRCCPSRARHPLPDSSSAAADGPACRAHRRRGLGRRAAISAASTSSTTAVGRCRSAAAAQRRCSRCTTCSTCAIPQYFSTVRRAYLRVQMPRSLRAADRRRRAQRVRRAHPRRRLRRRGGQGRRRPPRLRPAAADGAARGRRPAPPLRARRPAGARVPGDHPSAQGPSPARRAARRAVVGRRSRPRPPRGRRRSRRRCVGGDRFAAGRRPGRPPRSGARRRSRRARRPRRGARVPVRVRGLRRPGARGDGARGRR